MAKKSAQKSGGAASKAIKTNEKGEIISWDSNGPDGKALKALFDGGLITTETAAAVKNSYPRFRDYGNKTLNAALSGERKRLEKEADTQKARGSAAMKTHSNLGDKSLAKR